MIANTEFIKKYNKLLIECGRLEERSWNPNINNERVRKDITDIRYEIDNLNVKLLDRMKPLEVVKLKVK